MKLQKIRRGVQSYKSYLNRDKNEPHSDANYVVDYVRLAAVPFHRATASTDLARHLLSSKLSEFII
jgi:hypothetical protein